jgi:methyltransferase (TIGR00027 family)
MFVSLARGLVAVDPVAADLLPRPLSALISAARRAPWIVDVMRVLSLGLVDHQARRTKAIDHAVAETIGGGATQLVILGAGLDARAWRLPAAATVRVFEVDHPSTQAWKRDHAPRDRTPTFVAVDFMRDSLDERLQSAGHDPTQPTAWIWEGVTMYLDRAAIAGTLAVVAKRSAPKSSLSVTYVAPGDVTFGPLFLPVANAVLDAIGEPLRGALPPSEFAALVEDAGLAVRSDTSPTEWAAAHGLPRPRIHIGERLLVATKS